MRHLLHSLLIAGDATTRQAMLAIDRGAAEIALVVDDDLRLLGTVSDGDVRRALLAGHGLDDPIGPHGSATPRVVRHGTSRAEVLDLMRAQSLSQIPVVDRDGRLVGLHLIRALLGGAERPNWAVVMAGGRGTRLGALTDRTPKPMLRIASRPILERIVLHLVGSGIREVFLSVNYRREVIEEHFGDGSQLGCTIRYLREEPDRQLGTCGSLRLLREDGYEPDAPLLVMNGDLVTDFSVENLFANHELSGAIATVAVRAYSHTIPFGVTETVGTRLGRLTEKPTESWLINAGIYVLEPRLLSRVPGDREYHVPDLLNECLARGEQVHTWHTDDDWQDIGLPDELARATGRASAS